MQRVQKQEFHKNYINIIYHINKSEKKNMDILVDANKGIYKIKPSLEYECFLKKYNI